MRNEKSTNLYIHFSVNAAIKIGFINSDIQVSTQRKKR